MAEMTDAEIIAELKREPAAELRRLQKPYNWNKGRGIIPKGCRVDEKWMQLFCGQSREKHAVVLVGGIRCAAIHRREWHKSVANVHRGRNEAHRLYVLPGADCSRGFNRS